MTADRAADGATTSLDLAIRDLTVEYRSGGYPIRPLDGFEMDARDGEMALMLGPSGCGKTTLLACLGGILTPTTGSIRIGDTTLTEPGATGSVRSRREQVGVVFRSFNLISSLTVLENVAAPFLVAGQPRRQARRGAQDLLEQVGMSDHAHDRPAELSGGQQQRIAIARGLAHDPLVLVADEPTADLDHIQAEAVIRLLRGLARPGRIVMNATHDDRLIPIADRVVELAPHDRSLSPPGRPCSSREVTAS